MRSGTNSDLTKLTDSLDKLAAINEAIDECINQIRATQDTEELKLLVKEKQLLTDKRLSIVCFITSTNITVQT